MEKLPSDMKMELSKKLKGEDILNLSRTSKEMYKMCSSDRYDPLWQNKLKEEFNIQYRGKKSYNRYMQEASLYKRNFYQLEINFDGDRQYHLFTTREEAVHDAIEILLEDEENYQNYHELREYFIENDSYENDRGYLSCEITMIRLNKKSNFRQEEYEERKEKIQEKFGENYNYNSFLSLIYHAEEELYRDNYENVDAALDDLMGEFLPDKYLFEESSLNEDSPYDNDIFRKTKSLLKPLFPKEFF